MLKLPLVVPMHTTCFVMDQTVDSGDLLDENYKYTSRKYYSPIIDGQSLRPMSMFCFFLVLASHSTS